MTVQPFFAFDPANIRRALKGISDVILIAGPAGAGKTTIAANIISGEIASPFTTKHLEAISRTDCKSLPDKNFAPGGLVVEFAINRLHDPDFANYVISLIDHIAQNANIQEAYVIELGRAELIKRYISRMKPMHFVHLGKLKSLLGYMFSSDFSERTDIWHKIVQERGIPCRQIEAME
ncbi:MAG: hypothetical protein COA52_07185 [Hyphomicrobiales bacterium]|nr:hypothetical protein [Hyphomicrobiales bacterium]PCJ92736.1 MAG: hypothetical protein COA52_07185 [Hyphomicrobiales bacterium]